MEQAEKLVARAYGDLGAAACLVESYPVHAMAMIEASVTNTLRAACHANGFDFEKGANPSDMVCLVSAETWARTSENDIVTLLNSCEALLEKSEVEGDFLKALAQDMKTAAAFLYDVEEIVTMPEPMHAAAMG